MKATLYPSKIEQPNVNKSSGLAGKCLKEIRRDKSVHDGNCRTQKDPKYHHGWSNTSELKTGGTTQCGRKSSYHCSHKTYYSIKGYRNTCPIAGVNGTYTQPATLRLHFDPISKNITSTSKIKSVKLSISHRCTGVDVANDKEYDTWGPNFSGFKTYPNREVLTIKFAGEKQTYNKNPPLSKSKFDKISFTFKDVSYSDLSNGYIDIIYGNNLSSNPGNIYLKGISIEVDFQEGTPYLEGKQSTNEVYLASDDRPRCRTPITFTMEAGYKHGSTKLNPDKFPKKIQKNIKVIKKPDSLTLTSTLSNDGKTVIFTGKDNSNEEGVKTVTFEISGTKIKKSFTYEAKRRSKPTINIPEVIEKNTFGDEKTGITIKDGCAYTLTVYDEGITGDNITLTLSPENDNLLSQEEKIRLYNWISSLDCGIHTLLFRRDNESNDQMIQKKVKIVGTNYRIFFQDNNKIIHSLNLVQDKTKNYNIEIVFEKTKEFIQNPTFTISNPTFGLEQDEVPTPKRINDDLINWEANKEGDTYSLTIGTYHPGTFEIVIENPSNCSLTNKKLIVNIEPTHKQYFDEIFVRGEDSTSFNYEYLVALEGDEVTEPITVDNVTVGSSYEDLKICAKRNNLAQLTNLNTIPLSIKNTSSQKIENLLLELNAIIKNEDGDFEVTTTEWMDEEGVFYNFKEKFKDFNEEGINNIIDIKNLSEDDDFIDEENVYLHIKKIDAGENLNIEIPFGSYIEKEVYLQILFSGEILSLYDKEDCSDKNLSFNEIFLKVYDSTLTEMSISGDLDILELSDKNCPLKCFKTENGIKYKIKNVDTQKLEKSGQTIIKNDPRLIPYAYKLVGDSEPRPIDQLDSKLLYRNFTKMKEYIIKGTKVCLTTGFEDYDNKTFFGYTNSNGIVTFYIEIPYSIGRSFTPEQLFNLCEVEVLLSDIEIYNVEFIDDFLTYYPGQVIPLMLKITHQKENLVNEFVFTPNITNPGMIDEVIIYYKVCNLKKNQGVLKTTFKTDTYNLIENKVEKDIIFGTETNLKVYSQLKKIVTEKNNYNRLYLTVTNKDRFNKDIKIVVKEMKEILKYQFFYSNVSVGEVFTQDNDVIWSIPYLDKNTTIRGYIDFKAKEIGFSKLSIEAQDFLTDADIEFDRDDCKCPRG